MSSIRILVAISDIASESLLAWPALTLLLKAYPHGQISLLTASRGLSLSELFTEQFQVINDDQFTTMKARLAALNQANFQAYICLSPKRMHRWLGLRLGIKKRFSTHFAYRLWWDGEAFGRRAQPLQLRLAYQHVAEQFLAQQQNNYSAPSIEAPFIEYPPSSVNESVMLVSLDAEQSESHLHIEQYAQLLLNLQQIAGQWRYLICVHEPALTQAQRLRDLLQRSAMTCEVATLHDDWHEMAQLVAQAKLVIAEPGTLLWLSGALDRPCVGFSALPLGTDVLRHPLSKAEHCLWFMPPAGRLTQQDVSLINMTDSAVRIHRWYAQLLTAERLGLEPQSP